MRCHRKMSMIHCYVKKLQKYVYNIILFFFKVYICICVCVGFFFSYNQRKIGKGIHQAVHGDHLEHRIRGGIILLYILVNILNYVNSTLFCTDEIKQNKVYLLGMCRGFSNSLFQDHI